LKSPKHIAIIMDGNGRWARQRGKVRTKGHEEGAKKVRVITEAVANSGVKYLTLYAFSTENWERPKSEVDFLMKLLERYLKSEEETYQKNSIRFETIGDMSRFSDGLREQIESLKEKTRANKKLTQVLAINYGSKDEIARAAAKVAKSGEKLCVDTIEGALDTDGMPPVDMLIRTGGEKRLSNFLLWQSAYAELFFTDTLWPDFEAPELFLMTDEFRARERRFGKV